MLQQRLLTLRERIELVDVDKRKRGQSEVDGGIVLEIDLVIIVVAQLLRQDDTAEGGLSAALIADEHWHDGVAVIAVDALPMGHHREHPRVEVADPVIVTRHHPLCQRSHTVDTIPAGQLLQPLVHRVELRYHRRLHIALDILVPRVEAGLERTDRHGIHHILRQVAETVVIAVLRTILGHTRHHVLAELIARIEERLRLKRQQLRGFYMLQRPGRLQRLAVLRVEHRLHILRILIQPSVIERHPHGKGLFDAAFMTVERQDLQTMGHEILFPVEPTSFERISLAGLILMTARCLGCKARNPPAAVLLRVIVKTGSPRQPLGSVLKGRYRYRGRTVIEIHIRIMTQQTARTKRWRNVVYTDGQLGGIYIMVLGVGVAMELLNILQLIAVGILPHLALSSLTDDFHRSPVGPYEGNDGIGHEARLVSDLLCRSAVRQTVDLQQHTAVIHIGPLIGALCHQL